VYTGVVVVTGILPPESGSMVIQVVVVVVPVWTAFVPIL
jgi:hypothetical protein